VTVKQGEDATHHIHAETRTRVCSRAVRVLRVSVGKNNVPSHDILITINERVTRPRDPV
jgi:hypothetical protein